MRRYVTTLAMLASIVALALIKEVPLVIGIGLIIVGVIGTADQFVEDYRKNHENIKICKNQAEIESEMKELVKAQGKICIMSRDLSWVNPEIKEQLIKKNKNVRIFAQEKSPLTEELITGGVEVYYYGGLQFEPKTRFTIIRYNRPDHQVAIAETSSALKRKWFEHKIYETKNESLQDRFICSLSLDLMEMCRLACKREKDLLNELEKSRGRTE